MNKKVYAVMTSTAVATILTAAVSTTAFAKVDSFLVKDGNKLLSYDFDQIVKGAENNAMGLPSALYDDYLSKELVAFHDTKTGYVSAGAVKNASEDLMMEDPTKVFELNNFTEGVDKDKIYEVKTTPIERIEDKDGKVINKEDVLEISSVKVISKTEIKVAFNMPIDNLSKDNFAIKGGSVSAATLASNKKEATLQVSGLEFNKSYELEAKDLVINGNKKNDFVKDFKLPNINDVYSLKLSCNAKDDKIEANGADNTVITAELVNKNTKKVDVNANDMVVAFSATYGNLANSRVTIQNGKASVVLTSEYSSKDIISKVDAQIIEASKDYKDLIGKKQGTLNIDFVTSMKSIKDEKKPILVSIGSNEADRVTLNFNKEVSVEDFVKLDKDNKEFEVDEKENAVLVANNIIEVTQDKKAKAIRGIRQLPGNKKAIQVILRKDNVLEDNKEVNVKINMASNFGIQTSDANFILTDSRKPEATSVVAEGLKTIKIKLSEPICKADVSVDGGLMKIDKVVYGDFNQKTLTDERDIITLKTKDYLNSGKHSVQLASIYDFAGLTDKNNVSTSQTLDFTVEADESIPNAKILVESPEQFRVKFNKEIEKLNVSDIKLERFIKGKENVPDKWQMVNNWDSIKDAEELQSVKSRYAKEPKFDLYEVGDLSSEWVLELQQDWTQIYNTKDSNLNYYNDQYRIVIPKDKVKNPANGKFNEDIIIPLTSGIMTSADVKSPEIVDFKPTEKVDIYNVIMSEPVKLPGFKKETPSQLQNGKVPTPVVEFIGKDEKGEAITIPGKVVGYGDLDQSDKIVTVKPADGYSLRDLVNKGAKSEWQFVVRSISDDVGNTAASLTHKFTITPDEKAKEEFMVDGIRNNKQLYHGVKGYLADDKNDKIELVFTSGVVYVGTIKNAVNPSNYLLNGDKLPKGTIIKISDSDNNEKNGYDTINIELPDGTLNISDNNVITLSKSLESYNEIKLSGNYEVPFKIVDKKDTSAKDDQAKPKEDKDSSAKDDQAKPKEDKDTVVDAQKNLDTAIKEAEKITPNNYKEEDIKAFNEVVKEAKKILDNKEATDEEKNKAEKSIKDAKKKLAPIFTLKEIKDEKLQIPGSKMIMITFNDDIDLSTIKKVTINGIELRKSNGKYIKTIKGLDKYNDNQIKDMVVVER